MSGRRCLYGIGPVSEYLRGNPADLQALFVSRARVAKAGKANDGFGKLIADAKNRQVRYVEVEQGELDRLSENGNHQGVVVIAGEFQYAELHQLPSAEQGTNLLVALDGVTDPHNLGAIIRSSLLLGADALLLPKDRSARVNALVAKTSAGASEHLPIVQVTNLVRALEDLKQEGFWAAAIASSADSRPLEEVDASGPLVLVLGSEGKGLRPLVAKACDFHLEIPMSASAVGSFNVSVAAAISLYEIARQRRHSATK